MTVVCEGRVLYGRRGYYVKNSHPAIVSAEVFELVQAELTRRDSGAGARARRQCSLTG